MTGKLVKVDVKKDGDKYWSVMGENVLEVKQEYMEVHFPAGFWPLSSSQSNKGHTLNDLQL